MGLKKFWSKIVLSSKSFGLENFWEQKSLVINKKIKFGPKEWPPKSLVKIGSLTAEIFLIWTNVVRTMLPEQISPWQLAFAKDGPRNLLLKFGQNGVSYSWDIDDIEFVWVGRWVGVQSHFLVSPNYSWGCFVVELGLRQYWWH